MVIDDTGSVEDIHAFIYCKKWRFGRVSRMPHSLTDSHLKDRATQLLIKYKSGALVTQSSFWHHPIRVATVAILDLFKVKYALK